MHYKKFLKEKATKKPVGCLIIFMLIFITPIVVMFFSHTTVLVSSSPNHVNKIKIINKGSSGLDWNLFGPTTIRIKSGIFDHIDRELNNGGATVDDMNVSVSWKNDKEATISLIGAKQSTDIIKFNADASPEFEAGQVVLSSKTRKKSVSPRKTNRVEVQEIIRSKGEAPAFAAVIYYGRNGSVLEDYVEYKPISYWDFTYQVTWEKENQAIIHILQKRENEPDELVDSIEVNIKQHHAVHVHSEVWK